MEDLGIFIGFSLVIVGILLMLGGYIWAQFNRVSGS